MVIFSKTAEKEWLEAQLHPQINQLRHETINTINNYVFVNGI